MGAFLSLYSKNVSYFWCGLMNLLWRKIEKWSEELHTPNFVSKIQYISKLSIRKACLDYTLILCLICKTQYLENEHFIQNLRMHWIFQTTLSKFQKKEKRKLLTNNIVIIWNTYYENIILDNVITFNIILLILSRIDYIYLHIT